MSATKEQERKALEKIKKIVSDLGPDSYLSTAFKGCFEDAEYNIENDFACSPYDRWISEKRRADSLEEQVKTLKLDYETFYELAEKKKAELISLQKCCFGSPGSKARIRFLQCYFQSAFKNKD